MTGTSKLTTERLLLRPVTAADADAVWRIHSDPRTNAHNPAGPMADPERALEQAAGWAADWRDDAHGYWAIELRDSPGPVVGFGGYRPSTWRDRPVFNLYYRFSPTVWGRGCATELAEAAVRHWREAVDARPLVAYTTSDNVASQRTAARAGLRRRPELDRAGDGYIDVVFVLGWDEVGAPGGLRTE